LHVTAINEPGCLGAIAAAIGDQGANIDDVRMTERSPDFRRMIIDLEVWDLKQLNAIMSHLRTLPAVSQVERVNG
jgi:GTP pyrophosphokinase